MVSGHFFFCPQSIQSRKRFTILENIINAEKLLRILYTPSIALRTSNNTHHLLQPLKIIIFLDEECEARGVFHNLPKFPWLLNKRTRPKTLVFLCHTCCEYFGIKAWLKSYNFPMPVSNARLNSFWLLGFPYAIFFPDKLIRTQKVQITFDIRLN